MTAATRPARPRTGIAIVQDGRGYWHFPRTSPRPRHRQAAQARQKRPHQKQGARKIRGRAGQIPRDRENKDREVVAAARLVRPMARRVQAAHGQASSLRNLPERLQEHYHSHRQRAARRPRALACQGDEQQDHAGLDTRPRYRRWGPGVHSQGMATNPVEWWCWTTALEEAGLPL